MNKVIRKIISNKSVQNVTLIFFLVISLVLFVITLQGGENFDVFRESVQRNIFLGIAVFLMLEIISIVIAPVTTIFIIPVAAGIFGPLWTALLSVFGWTVGSVIAFGIARRFGRPILEKIIKREKLEKYRNYVSHDAEFATVVLLRIILPADVISYAIGLFTMMRWKKFTLATAIGITPFAFIFSYGGEAIVRGDFKLFSGIAAGAFVLFLVIWGILKKIK